MEFRSHLSRARGNGASREGLHAWWSQRLTGVAMVPLTIWFIFSVASMTGASHEEFKIWVGSNGNPVLLCLLSIAMFQHAQIGISEVFEDYVHSENLKLACIALTKFAAAFCALASIFAVLRLTFGG